MQGSALARLPHPQNVAEVLLINCKSPPCSFSVFHLIKLNCPYIFLGYLSLFCFMTAVPRGVIYGCGDLIFSSHMIFTIVFVVTYQKYGNIRWCFCIERIPHRNSCEKFSLSRKYNNLRFCIFFKTHFRFIKMLAWCIAIAQSLLIIASRKHYSVDVVVAWWVVCHYHLFIYLFICCASCSLF